MTVADPMENYQRNDENSEAHAYQDQGPFAVESIGERPEQHSWDIRAHQQHDALDEPP